MIIDAKKGTINVVLFGADEGEGGIKIEFPYPDRADILNMDKDQRFKAVCEAHGDISDIKDMVHDIKLTFTAESIPLNFDKKEMSIEEIHKSFRQALEEIALQNKVIDLAVNEVCRCRGAKVSEESIKQGLFERCKGMEKEGSVNGDDKYYRCSICSGWKAKGLTYSGEGFLYGGCTCKGEKTGGGKSQ